MNTNDNVDSIYSTIKNLSTEKLSTEHLSTNNNNLSDTTTNKITNSLLTETFNTTKNTNTNTNTSTNTDKASTTNINSTTEKFTKDLSSDSSDTESFSDSSSESSSNSSVDKSTKIKSSIKVEKMSIKDPKLEKIKKNLDKIEEDFKKNDKFDGSDFLGINEALETLKIENFTYNPKNCLVLAPRYRNYARRYMNYFRRYMGYYRRYMRIYNRRRRSRNYWTRRYAYRYRNYANRYRYYANRYKNYSVRYQKASIRYKRFCLGGGNKECILAANNKWNANRYNGYYKRFMYYYKRDAIRYYRRYMNYSRRYMNIRSRYQRMSNQRFRVYGANYNKYKRENNNYRKNLRLVKRYQNNINNQINSFNKLKLNYNKFGEIANKYITDLNKITNNSNNIVNFNPNKNIIAKKLTYLQSTTNNYKKTFEFYYEVVNPSEKYRKYSSYWFNNAHRQSVIDNKIGTGGWSSRHNRRGHWLQIDLSKVRNVIGVQTQGRHSYNQWVRYFRVLISKDLKKWSKVDNNRYFKGNYDRYTKINNFFLTNMKARYVRIYPTHWYRHMSMRAAVIVSDYDYKFYNPPEAKRNYSSVWDRAISHKILNDTTKTCSLKLTQKQCLNVRDVKRLTGGNKRLARRYYNYYRRYIYYYNRYMRYYRRYMYLSNRYRRYRRRYRYYANRYRRYANRMKSYADRYYRAYKSQNEYKYKVSYANLPYGCSYYIDPRARNYNRIIYNVNKNAKKFKIKNSRNKRNKYCRSTRSWCYRSYNKPVCRTTEKLKITPHSKSTIDSVQAWSSRYNRIDQYITIDLEATRTVGGVVTQGRKNNNQWVTSFTAKYSLDNKTYKDIDFNYKFHANWDRNTKVTNLFNIPITARYIRIYPKSWYRHMSMRAAVILATNKFSLTVPTSDKPAWNEFRKLMLQQDNVGLRNSRNDKDTLSISDKSELSRILPKYSGRNWSKLFKNKGGTWDIGSFNYLFQKTYKLKDFPWKKFYEIIYKNSKNKTYKCYEARRNVANFNTSSTTINNFFNPKNINSSNMRGHVNTETKTIPSNMKNGKIKIYYNIRIKDQGWGNHTFGIIRLYNRTKNKNHTIVYKSARGGYRNYSGWIDISNMVSAGDKIYLHIRPSHWWRGHRMYWQYAKDFHIKFTPDIKPLKNKEKKSCTSITKSESSLKSASYKLPSKVIKIKPSQFTNIYIRAEIKTPSSFSSGDKYKDIFLIGGTQHCDALFGGFFKNKIFIGFQCRRWILGPVFKENTNYLIEFDYNNVTKKATIIMNNKVIKQEVLNLKFKDGFITIGSGYHTKDAEKFNGTIKSIQIYKNTKRADIVKAYKNLEDNSKNINKVIKKMNDILKNIDKNKNLKNKFAKIASRFKKKANNFLRKANYAKHIGNRYRNIANRYRYYANRYRRYANNVRRRGNNYKKRALAFQRKYKAFLAKYKKFKKKCVPEDKSCIPERRLRFVIFDKKQEYDKLMKIYKQNMKLFKKFKEKNPRKAKIYKNRAKNILKRTKPIQTEITLTDDLRKPYAKSCGTVEGPKFYKLYLKYLALYQAAKLKNDVQLELRYLPLVKKNYATYKRHQIAAGNSYYRRFDEPMPILPIILVILLVAAIGGGAYFYISTNSGGQTTASAIEPAVAEPAIAEPTV